MADWRLMRTSSILLLLALSAGTAVAWYTGTFFPWLHLAAFSSVLITLTIGLRASTGRLRFYWCTCMFSVIGVVLRAPMVLFPGTLSGNDPEKYAMFSRLTLNSGSYHLPTSDFYGIAGGFHTHVAQTAAIGGITPESALVVVSLLFGVWGPLVAASFCVLLLGSDNRGHEAGIIAAGIAAVTALSIRVSYIPFAQSMGTILFVSFVWAALHHVRLDGKERRLNWVLLILILFGMALTHKIPVLVASGLLWVGWFVTQLSSFDRLWLWGSSSESVPTNLVLVASLVALIQQTIITSFVSRALHRARATAHSSFEVPERVGSHPDAATVVDTGMLTIFESHSHAPVLLAVGGFAGIIVAWQLVVNREQQDAVLLTFLTTIGVLTLLVLLGLSGSLLSSVPHPLRFQVLQELLLAAVIGVGFVTFKPILLSGGLRSSPISLETSFVLILVVLLSFHAFASVAAPDYPGQERGYLTEGEVDGKEFTVDFVESDVWTDDRLQRQTPYRERIVDKRSPWVGLGAAPKGTKYKPNNIGLLQGTAVTAGRETVLYRPGEDTYETAGYFKDFRYRLTWDVERSADERYHRAYDNGHANVYRLPG